MSNTLGHVVGRILTHDDAPASGTVIFTPVTTTRLPDATPPAQAVASSITATLDESGDVRAALIPAAYDVTFRLRGVTRPPYRIAVTADHTDDQPLDLTTVSPVMPSPVIEYVANEATYREALAAVDTAASAADVATARAATATASASAAAEARDGAQSARTDAQAAASDAATAAAAAAADLANLQTQWGWTTDPEDPDVILLTVPDTWLDEDDALVLNIPMPTPRFA
ncbi:hypothetical protein [Microbacterium sp. NPDC077184]|uniref:hypothetical protein n=1 Tax=Microbacterium sp. NPDC077184 TaxID=3154764 RepID=UPI003438F6C2